VEAKRNEEKKTVQMIIIVLSFISAILYRLGGEFKTLYRDLGCSLVTSTAIQILANDFTLKFILANFISMGLLYGSLTTYCKIKGQEARWYNWLCTGLLYSLSAFPVCVVSGLWFGLLCRTFVLSASVMFISEMSDSVWVEECGRGGLLVLTLPLLWV